MKDKVILPDGSCYEGEWLEGTTDTRQGYGTQVWPDGSTYEGYWVDNRAHGKGRRTYANGDFYDGMW